MKRRKKEEEEEEEEEKWTEGKERRYKGKSKIFF